MNKYEEMSVFMTNQKVAITSGLRPSNEHECLKTGACYLLTDTHDVRIEFNPCNNWADMGPLMIEAGISIQLADVTLELEGSAYKWAEGHNMEITESNFKDNDEALRAAAIVYLMLNDQ